MDIVIQSEALLQFGTPVCSQLGLPPADANLVADSLVEADLRGVHSHGVLLMPGYVSRLKASGFNLRPAVRVVKETGGTVRSIQGAG